MYDFRHNFIKKNFNGELLFTDTNSLTYDQRMFMKSVLSGKVCLILVIIQMIQNVLIRLTKKLLAT